MENVQTPSDAVAVRKSLQRHREALRELQEGDNITPATQGLKPLAYDDENAYSPQNQTASPKVVSSLMSLLLYENPPLSILAILAGSFVLTTVRYILNGPHHMTFLSATCYLLLLQLAVNFVRSVLVATPTAGDWTGSAMSIIVSQCAMSAINMVSAVHDEFLTAKDPATALKIGVLLWSGALVGRYVGIWTLAATAFGLAFTVPYGLAHNARFLNAATSEVSRTIKSRWLALGLTRRQQAMILLSLVGILWLRSSWSSRLIGMLLGTLAIRCNLKPAEMDAIRQHAAPLTTTVKMRAARLSIAASDFAQRTWGNKLHFR